MAGVPRDLAARRLPLPSAEPLRPRAG